MTIPNEILVTLVFVIQVVMVFRLLSITKKLKSVMTPKPYLRWLGFADQILYGMDSKDLEVRVPNSFWVDIPLDEIAKALIHRGAQCGISKEFRKETLTVIWRGSTTEMTRTIPAPPLSPPFLD